MDTVNENIPPTARPSPGYAPRPRLTRSTDGKVVSGLSGGLGRYFGVDPVVFRIAFVVMALAGGSGILAYLVGWLLIPDDRGGSAVPRVGKERNQKLLAAILAGAGVLLLANQLTDRHGGDVPVGLVLVGIGGLVLWSRRTQDGTGGPPAPQSPPSGQPIPPEPPWSPRPASPEGVPPEGPPPEAPSPEAPSPEAPSPSPSPDPPWPPAPS
ncbi:MAG: PspC domain-containing protein, partial [Actinomycetota bacterium]|nr:PspC domain-containing protein [Actinomycetota bacterium]